MLSSYLFYITWLTIGSGNIVPVTPVAQKAAVLAGIVGPFYIIIVTTVVIGKYIFFTRKQVSFLSEYEIFI